MFWHLGVEQLVNGNLEFMTQLFQRPTLKFVKPTRLLDTNPSPSQPLHDVNPGLLRLNSYVGCGGEHRLLPFRWMWPQKDG